jgi:membrane protein
MNDNVVWRLVSQTFREWSEHKVPRLGAALAYYSVFSLAPLLLVVIAVAGVVFGRDAAHGRIIEEVEGVVGIEAAQAINKILQNASKPTEGFVASMIAVAVLLIGATGAFSQLQDALNTIWEVTPKPGRGWKGIVWDRVLSLGVVACTAFLMLVSLVVSAALAALGRAWGPQVGHWLHIVISFAVTAALFGMIYKILPDAQIGWHDVWLGGIVASLLFTIGKWLIGLYIARTSVASVYGAAGSLVVILIWIYYSSQIFLLGAEFTRAYATAFGARIRPKSYATKVTAEDRVRQGMPRRVELEEANC